MRTIRVGFVAVLAALTLVTGLPSPAWAATPEHQVPAASASEIELEGGGSIVFPDNGARVMELAVDVVQSGGDDSSLGGAPDGLVPASGLVTVLAEDSAGVVVTELPNDVIDPAEVDNGHPAAELFVPGLELVVPVDATAVDGTPPNDVGLYLRPTHGAGWELIPSAFDPATGLVTGHSDRLGDFAVFAAEAEALPVVAAAHDGPTVVLDPDNDVGFATWGAELTELEQNLQLTAGLTAALERLCRAEVVTTRGDTPDDILPSVRAQIAENAAPDLMVTLAFNALDEAGREPGSIWGDEDDGGVRAWATSTGDEAFAQRFLDAVPEFTGRPSTLGVQPFDGLVPYPALDAVDVTYAHIEMLFLDHAFDQPVIADRFDLVVAAAADAIVGQLEADGFECGDDNLPQRPPAEELQTLRNLGWQNHLLYGADPVSFSSGNLVMDQPVFSLSGVGDQIIDFNLVYNSQDDRESIFGVGWSFPYNAAYRQYFDGGVLIRLGDGRSLVFEPGPGGTFMAPPGGNSTLTRVGGGIVELVSNNTEKHRFRVDPATGVGVLASSEDRQGNTMTFEWGDPAGPRGLQSLQRVTDEAGQTVELASDGDGHITSITHPDGRIWRFTYDGTRLASITDARDVTRTFEYGDGGYLSTVTAGDGVVYVTNGYDDEGRVVSQENATGDVRRFDYQDGRTIYTDALGNDTTYVFNDQGSGH